MSARALALAALIGAGASAADAPQPGALTAAVKGDERATSATWQTNDAPNASPTANSALRSGPPSARPAAAGSLAAAVRRAAVDSWIEYRVPLIDPNRSPCCYGPYNDGERMQRGCELDRRGNIFINDGDRDGARAAQNALLVAELRVFLHRDADGIDGVRAFGADCPVDAADQSVATLGRVDASESLKVLQALALDQARKVRNEAFVAMAHHEGAVPVLRAIVESDRPKAQRKEALFWLGQVGDDAAFEVFDALLAEPNVSRR